MEAPFYSGTRYKEIDVLVPFKEYDYRILNKSSIGTLIDIVDRFYEEKKDKQLWDLYLVLYSRMTPDTYITFDEFKNYGSMDTRSTDQIKEEIEEIERQFKD